MQFISLKIASISAPFYQSTRRSAKESNHCPKSRSSQRGARLMRIIKIMEAIRCRGITRPWMSPKVISRHSIARAISPTFALPIASRAWSKPDARLPIDSKQSLPPSLITRKNSHCWRSRWVPINYSSNMHETASLSSQKVVPLIASNLSPLFRPCKLR